MKESVTTAGKRNRKISRSRSPAAAQTTNHRRFRRISSFTLEIYCVQADTVNNGSKYLRKIWWVKSRFLVVSLCSTLGMTRGCSDALIASEWQEVGCAACCAQMPRNHTGAFGVAYVQTPSYSGFQHRTIKRRLEVWFCLTLPLGCLWFRFHGKSGLLRSAQSAMATATNAVRRYRDCA